MSWLRAEPASIRVFPLHSRLGATARPPKARTGFSTTATDGLAITISLAKQGDSAMRLNAAWRRGWTRARYGNGTAGRKPNSRCRVRSSLLFAALALTGCATTHLYTSVPCLTPSQYNDLKAKEPPKVHDQLNGDAAHDVGPLAGSAIRLRAYSDGLLTVLGGCTGPSK